MPTPDPIALPELPEPFDIVEQVDKYNFVHNVYVYDADQMRAYGQACVESLTPAPHVQGDMVLVPREATPEMVAAGSDHANNFDADRTRIIYAAMLSAAPPLNELLGQREEFNLNEVSGNPGQLASLEPRARELLASRDHNSECHFWQQDGGEETCDCGLTELRAITAALSAQPRGVEEVDRALAYLRPHLEAGTFAAPDWAISLASILTGGNAAPQPREVRDREADRKRFPDKDFNYWLDCVISDAGHTVYDAIGDVADAWQGWDAHVVTLMIEDDPLFATTPQDAAGVEDNAHNHDLWCLHLRGPDDVHAAPSKAEAERVATQVNEHFSGHDVRPNAVAALWPHSPESHAESVNDWETKWGAGAATARASIWIQFSEDGRNIRFWTRDQDRAVSESFCHARPLTAFYTTPPPGVDVGKLRELVKWMREKATVGRRTRNYFATIHLNIAADELTAAIDAAGEDNHVLP